MFMGHQFEHITQKRKIDPIFRKLGAKVINELEEAYGKYIHIPFDIPIIKPNDMQKFVDWYDQNSMRAVKQYSNTANEAGVGNNHFRTVDGIIIPGQIWTQNSRLDIWDVFPELKEQILEYLPILELRNWRMWSSTMEIYEHRDDDPMVDFPLAWRCKLYDENPKETLYITKDIGHLPHNGSDNIKYTNWLPEDSNTWAWNNVRTFHGSKHDAEHTKILWLISSDNGLNVNKYIDLMDRSIAKYKDNLIVDQEPYSTYYDKAW